MQAQLICGHSPKGIQKYHCPHRDHLPGHCRGLRLRSRFAEARGRSTHIAQANNSEEESGPLTPQVKDNVIIWGTAIGLTSLAALCGTVWREPLLDFVYDQSISDGGEVLGAGDIVGGLLWALSLYYASPLQLLLLFLGRLDTTRPSDGVLRLLGIASGQPVDAIDYEAPLAIRVVAVLGFVAAGLGIAALFRAGLGDATWSTSSGIGACIAAGVYEVGRPKRLSVQDAQLLESQWQDFAAFAAQKLQKSGRCHESEIFKQFRRSYAKYRSEEAISDDVLRDMVRNFHPDVDRTPKGFFKNLSLIPSVDAFGEPVGGTASSPSANRSSMG
uniref:Uncharacterized protein n=1 Tax=Dunaliella tertiolecta TaxID=3047 RepID=A0A7S3VVQ5_DUNTE|mmetsp:Transcript_1801/g.4574  ORF Transcript_1801/g.4574 Transcript_1801/m.4574 type:complete len:330 (-) Transcript_1801:222-1211(-)|eukprot:CAMPEP_0202354146 /NCGR_PEP_ID=MMETSP1126-20121109/9596_1 /ASSEMBLY_ACC=CAM_ASM_000457 /TAXON_ID=3047 /ORGANISM="Dunaliella tertiolecta, Strain CCMP1320" /LENGTH=329 /DNA_ID=CAMNT_0048946581 /DNA_START=63 /DNA_END=1052 /DNA_ORIENTATION=+